MVEGSGVQSEEDGWNTTKKMGVSSRAVGTLAQRTSFLIFL